MAGEPKSISRNEVAHLARLSRLALSEDELAARRAAIREVRDAWLGSLPEDEVAALEGRWLELSEVLE